MPSFFRRWIPSKKTVRVTQNERDRGTSAERGYDFAWQKLRIQYQKEHPFCEECRRRGRLELMTVVDHISPIRWRPDLRLSWDNLQSLCSSCHGWKARVERYAEVARKEDMVATWMREPETRPKPFQIM